MSTDEYSELVERIRTQAEEDAIAFVTAAELPGQIVLTEQSVSGIGKRGELTATRLLLQYQDRYGKQFPKIVAFAARQSLYSLARGAAFISHGRVAGLLGSNAHTNMMCTPEGYGESEGVAYVLYDRLHEVDPTEAITGCRELTGIDIESFRTIVLEAAALYWFSEAAAAIGAGDHEKGLDILGEALDALSLSEYDRGWRDALKDRELSQVDPASFARKGADARHRENRAMREQVFSFLDQHEFPSMDAAAEAIAGKLVPAKFRTVRDWIGQWKKARAKNPSDQPNLQVDDT